MSEKFENYLTNYIKTRIGVYKKYLLAALDSKLGSIWYVEISEGTMMPTADLKNCELLRDAQLFTEDTKISRNGRTTYKIYTLTEEGKMIAQELKNESMVAEDDPMNQPETGA